MADRGGRDRYRQKSSASPEERKDGDDDAGTGAATATGSSGAGQRGGKGRSRERDKYVSNGGNSYGSSSSSSSNRRIDEKDIRRKDDTKGERNLPGKEEIRKDKRKSSRSRSASKERARKHDRSDRDGNRPASESRRGDRGVRDDDWERDRSRGGQDFRRPFDNGAGNGGGSGRGGADYDRSWGYGGDRGSGTGPSRGFGREGVDSRERDRPYQERQSSRAQGDFSPYPPREREDERHKESYKESYNPPPPPPQPPQLSHAPPPPPPKPPSLSAGKHSGSSSSQQQQQKSLSSPSSSSSSSKKSSPPKDEHDENEDDMHLFKIKDMDFKKPEYAALLKKYPAAKLYWALESKDLLVSRRLCGEELYARVMALRYPHGIYPRGYGLYPDEQLAILEANQEEGDDEGADGTVKNESKDGERGEGGDGSMDLDAMLASLSKQAAVGADSQLAASIDDLLGTMQSGAADEVEKEESVEEEPEPEDEDDLYGGLGGGGGDGDDMYGDLAEGDADEEDEEDADKAAEADQMVVDGQSAKDANGSGNGSAAETAQAPAKVLVAAEEELTDLQRMFRYTPPFNCWEIPDQPPPLQDVETSMQDLSFDRLQLISQVNNGTSFSSLFSETLPQLQKLLKEKPPNPLEIS